MSRLWDDPVLGRLARELYRRCGLVFEGGQAHLFRRRIERRAAELGYDRVEAYIADLTGSLGEPEHEHLVELLTVNETYFFREEEHFRALIEHLWPRWASGRQGPVRIWSAACSNGCEPYTLAILLRERGMVGAGWPQVEILGTDVNARVLADAREGVYGEFALRNTPEHYRKRYFVREGHLYRLVPEVRSMVTFRRDNLVRSTPGPAPGSHHAVLCRNVLIYFDTQAKRRVVRRLVSVLRPGGVLIVGRSESLFNVPEAPSMVNIGGVLMYQRPEEGPVTPRRPFSTRSNHGRKAVGTG